MLLRADDASTWARIARAVIALLALLSAAPAAANDGFFHGSGFELVPVKNHDLRVVREKLRITPLARARCYPILYRGRPILKVLEDPRTEYPEEPKRSDFRLGKNAEGCHDEIGEDEFRSDALVAMFYVEVSYSIVARRAVRNVQLGFPVPPWDPSSRLSDPRLEIPTDFPGAAGFVTSIDGAAVPETRVRLLQVEDPRDGSQVPGYVWNASFSAGRHELHASYDFGYNLSADYYEGREYPEGERPWFLDPGFGSAFHLRYYLTPIRTWAPPPPKRMSIRVDIPTEASPVEFWVPVQIRPTCVAERSLHFELVDTFPEQELALTFPAGVDGEVTLRRLSTIDDWEAWRRSLGGDGVKLTCELRDRLAKYAEVELRAILKRTTCVRSCERG